MKIEELNKSSNFGSQNKVVLGKIQLGNEKPLVVDSTGIIEPVEQIGNRKYYYQKFSSYLLDRNQRIGRIKKRNEGIVLSIENIVFDKEELYFVIQIENKSTLDYDLNFLKFSVRTRQKGKRKSLQTLYQEPLFIHNRPTKIAENETVGLVYVMPKFSISDDRRVILGQYYGNRKAFKNYGEQYSNIHRNGC